MAFRIVLDPGHGTLADKYGVNRFSEAKSCLRIAKMVEKELLSTGQFLVKLTKTIDIACPGLLTRGRTAGSFKADMFLSIHENGFDGTAHGVFSFYSVDIPKDEKWTSRFSTEIAKVIKTNVRGGDGAGTRASSTYKSKPDPSTLEDYYSVIDSAQDIGCPHVILVECGFKDNLNDYKGITAPAPGGEFGIAVAIAKVICEMFNVAYRGSTPPAQPKPPAPPPAKSIRDIAIAKLGSDKTVSKNDPRKALVKEIQTLLNKKINAKLIVDGLFGSKTYAAVVSYQKKNALVVDGVVGVNTLTKLLS